MSNKSENYVAFKVLMFLFCLFLYIVLFRKGYNFDLDWNWWCCNLQVKTTITEKYCVRPNNGVMLPRSACDIKGFVLYP